MKKYRRLFSVESLGPVQHLLDYLCKELILLENNRHLLAYLAHFGDDMTWEISVSRQTGDFVLTLYVEEAA